MTVGVALVLPVKSLSLAKSRLELAPCERALVAMALARHTLGVVAATAQVDLVVVVTADPQVADHARSRGAVVTAEPRRGGLVAAVLAGRRTCRRVAPDADVAVMVSDLPDLSPADLDEVLREYGARRAPMFVADHLGTGTTLLVHPAAVDPPVCFGAHSAHRHLEAGYLAVRSPVPGLRRDLDTTADLGDRQALSGLGIAAAG